MMKFKTAPLLGAACLVVSPAASAGLIAHYTFDNVADLGANTGSATINWNSFDNVTQSTGHIGAGAGSFVAGPSQAWTNGFNSADLSSFTVSLHIKTPVGGSDWDDFISVGTGGSIVHVLEQTGAKGLANYNINSVGGDNGEAGLSNAVNITDGEWHHIGMTVGSGVATLYVDGVNRSSGAYTGSGTITAFQLASRFGDGGRAMTAEIDDVAVYDTALNDAQMAYLANNVAVNNPVPEPASLALLAFGGVLITRRRRV